MIAMLGRKENSHIKCSVEITNGRKRMKNKKWEQRRRAKSRKHLQV
jgi:hypothetical protein